MAKRGLISINLHRAADYVYRKVVGVPTIRWSQVTPQLHVGGQYSRRGVQLLAERGITAIVNMREVAQPHLSSDSQIRFLHLPTPDNHAPTVEQLMVGVKFIRQELEQHGSVYIHCNAGIGRGPTMLAAYLISSGVSLAEALDIIQSSRTFINPTAVQLQRLSEFERLVAFRP